MGKKGTEAIRRRRKWISLPELLKFRASVDRFRFRHSRDDRADQTRFKAFFDRATASETPRRCSSFFFSNHPAPFPFISVTFDVSRAATFCIIQEANLRETPGLRDSAGTGVSISSGDNFFGLSLIKLDERRRRSRPFVARRALMAQSGRGCKEERCLRFSSATTVLAAEALGGEV